VELVGGEYPILFAPGEPQLDVTWLHRHLSGLDLAVVTQLERAMTSLTKDPMEALSKAIKAADENQLMVAYRQLTDACNTCHQSAEVGMIVVQTPDSSPYPDQDFGQSSGERQAP